MSECFKVYFSAKSLFFKIQSLNTALCEVSQVSIACSSGKDIKTKKGAVRWWDDADRRSAKCHFSYHKPHKVWPGIKTEPRW